MIMPALPRRPVTLLVLGVALLASLIIATAAPHLHLGREAGFFNEEHDLSLFAASTTHAPLPEGAPVIALGGVVAATILLLSSRPAFHPGRIADPRAPPVA